LGAERLVLAWCRFAHDSRLRASLYSEAVERVERQTGRASMSRNIAAGRAIHPVAAGRAAYASLRRLGVEGCTILAEAGPADSINRWTDTIVYASTDVDAPSTPALRAAPATLEPEQSERGC